MFCIKSILELFLAGLRAVQCSHQYCRTSVESLLDLQCGRHGQTGPTSYLNFQPQVPTHLAALYSTQPLMALVMIKVWP